MAADRNTPDPALTAALQRPDQNAVRGLMLMALAFLCFSTSDIQAKLLAQTYHPVQLAWMRMLGMVAGVVVVMALRGPGFMKSRRPMVQIGRGLTAAVSSLSFLAAIGFVPLADAVAVSFVTPLLVTAMGALFLGEQVGPRRRLAIALGLVGTLIVIRPGLGVFHPAMMLVLVAAAAFALRQILSRVVAAGDRTATTIAYTSLTNTAVLFIPMLIVWQTPGRAADYLLFAGLIVFAAAGEMLVVRALETAEAVILAPVHYTLLIWGTFYGWMVFGQLPDRWTLIGVSVIIGTGIYVLHRERQQRRRIAAAEVIQ